MDGVNGSCTVEWRAIDGAPVPYMVTIQRCELTLAGDEYDDGGSDWETVTIGEIMRQLALSGPVSAWLRESTRVDCDAVSSMEAQRDEPAYLRNVNWGP
jgi:hypothetical protein